MLKNRHAISKKEAKKIAEKIRENFGSVVEGNMEIADMEGIKIILINRKLAGMFFDSIPVLNVVAFKEYTPTKKYVVVDDGAIKYILNGADVMAAGIVDADDGISENDAVVVRDERGMPIAVGIALMNGVEMKEAKKGKAVKNMHHIGDKIWNMSKG